VEEMKVEVKMNIDSAAVVINQWDRNYEEIDIEGYGTGVKARLEEI
jgi:hypothetical protein